MTGASGAHTVAAEPPPLRRHQQEALDALREARAQGRQRAWVVLPPGAGKTRVGLEEVRRRTDVDRAVVLGPNSAIQVQWEAQARALGIEAGTGRDLTARLTALTYQSLAVFDADAEVDDEGDETSLLARLHDNGRALVDRLRDAGPILLVLDECHHLLEVWGRLLQELLEELPEAHVLGLTATPPEALTGDQAALVAALFGQSVYAVPIPAVVREGDLAPFAELVWLTEPTATERQWLHDEGARFTELVTQLTDVDFGSTGFLTWLDLRFLQDDVPWHRLQRRHPELCDAALRMHHHGLLALPPGATLGEQHRRPPTPTDWVALIEDWVAKALGGDEDEQVRDAVRRALPAVGYQLTSRGIRRGRTPADRVLARSAAKTRAAVEIASREHAALGERMRTLVLCDHERAGAVLPHDLRGVLDPQAGSAYAALCALVADETTATLGPLMVTGRTVAGAPDTLAVLRAHAVAAGMPGAATLEIRDEGEGVATLEGAWSSRTWVPLVTDFFQAGHCRVLVGTRALLGEGWDAQRITALVDLTAATTTTAVVQARGRALRTDPQWPGKVALNWSVVCVAEEHPKGQNDWERLVRKHRGFLAVDHDGDVVDGVAHLDPELSPFAPPPAADFDAVNARMLVRAEDRAGIRERWQVGEPYAGRHAHALRVRVVPERLTGAADPPAVVVGPESVEAGRDGPRRRRSPVALGAVTFAALATAVALVGALWWLLPLAFGAAGLAWVAAARAGVAHRRALLEAAARPPGIGQVGRAVADALHDTGQVGAGAEAVVVDIDHDGRYRCHLEGVCEEESALFATSLEEVLAPVGDPRYLISRWTVPPGLTRLRRGGRLDSAALWHAVPTALGRRGDDARALLRAWEHWVGAGEVRYTRSPEGAGTLAACRGTDPFRATSVVRRHWS